MTDLSGIVAVEAGATHSLALDGDGDLWAFGWNVLGQLGDGTTQDTHVPVRVGGGVADVVAIDASGFYSIALSGDGRVWTWPEDQLEPVEAPEVAGARAVAVGDDHALVVASDGRVRAWGRNTDGQLGDGSTSDRTSPIAVAGPAGVVGVAASAGHSLAWTGAGELWCLGSQRAWRAR